MARCIGGKVPLAGGARTRRRRGPLALVVGLLAVGTLVASPASGQEHGHDGLLPPGDWSEEQQMALHDLIERTATELPAFGDVDMLPELGFHNFGFTVEGWDHWINREWVDDDRILDPTRPESLVFRSTADGWVLEAAMFFMPTGVTMEDIPEELAWMPGWHQHPELCLTPDWRYAGLTDGAGGCWSGAPSDMPPMLHVWLVDPGCGHRFGGVGIGGLHCDVGHDHGPDPMPPTTPPPAPPSTPPTPPPAPPAPPTSVSIVLQPGVVTPDPATPRATRATPVRAQPDYAG